MSFIAIVNAVGLSSHATEDLGAGESALGRVGSYLDALAGIESRVVLADREGPGLPGADSHILSGITVAELFGALVGLGAGHDHVLYVNGDCPFLDAEVSLEMMREHREYYADYSFADGYPQGMTPEIISVEALPRIAALAGPEPIGRSSLFQTIQKDINAFDIETTLSPVDMRLLRISLTTDTRRNTLLCRRLLAACASAGLSPLEQLRQDGRMLRTLPAFFNVQIVEGCPQNCSYCPYPGMRGEELGKRSEMSLERFVALTEQIESFCEDATISVSLWGEPAYHSAIADLAEAVLRRPSLDLVVETSGVGWDLATLHRIHEQCERPPLWIVSLDAHDPGLYRRLRGDGRADALATVDTLLELAPERVHVQAVRMQENEEDLEVFYREWKKRVGDRVIIQKYDHFSHELPERKVTDLSPLQRIPCWHIKRDMHVLLDGTVPLCREDLSRKHILGNAFEEPLETIWMRGTSYHEQHLAEDYPEICRGCDEYYTYNF